MIAFSSLGFSSMKGDWHELLGSTSISSTALAAACSSVITKAALFPVDTAKCRLQSGLGLSRSLALSGIMNGLIPKLMLYAPYQGIYMSVYTDSRDRLHSSSGPGDMELWKFALAGVSAELAGSVVRVPMETIKQRMQMGAIQSHRNLLHLLKSDPGQFFKPRNFLAQTLVHDIPCGTVHWVVYEYVKRRTGSEAATAGAVAGSTTALLTNPLDVIKTRMITKPNEYPTVQYTVSSIYSKAGVRGFFAGVLPRVLHIAPNSALYMWIFDRLYKHIEYLRSD